MLRKSMPYMLFKIINALIFTFHFVWVFKSIFFLMWSSIVQRSFLLMNRLNKNLNEYSAPFQFNTYVYAMRSIQQLIRKGILIWRRNVSWMWHTFSYEISETFWFSFAVSISASHCFSLFLNMSNVNFQQANIMGFESNNGTKSPASLFSNWTHDFQFVHH